MIWLEVALAGRRGGRSMVICFIFSLDDMSQDIHRGEIVFVALGGLSVYLLWLPQICIMVHINSCCLM